MSIINNEYVASQLKDGEFYWVKWNKISKFEIAKYLAEDKKFRFTDCSITYLADACEIDTTPVSHKSEEVIWTDKKILEFVTIAVGGSYCEYAEKITTESKLNHFKKLNGIK